MDDSRTDQPARRLREWLDPEMVAYSLVGLFFVGLAARTLARWIARSWVEGQRAGPIIVVSLVVAAVTALLFVLRRRKRWLQLGLVLVAVGFVTYVLVSAEIALPRSWFE